LYHRIFTDEYEATIADDITAELISQGSLSSGDDFETLVLNEYLMRILANDHEPLEIFWPAVDS
jgi:hypothetical protein